MRVERDVALAEAPERPVAARGDLVDVYKVNAGLFVVAAIALLPGALRGLRREAAPPE